ncbi:hypothetical protein PAPYR_4465 [Paratrimastix pyriformis]|uniref:F-box domain-containing protein n=1 Tax=Paratrimastix pyriformis TaxID=342808 RepID=A0ABQ8UN40_9EUKA|nr:hypothetical protein PAPYR_4465 [Paratrimastix pyriformis]
MDNQKSHKVLAWFFLLPHLLPIFPKTPTLANNLWAQLPPDLLRAIVEASSSPFRTYIQLLSLSHTIRSMIRGILRQMSFQTAEIDVDALAALIGPCKGLGELAFPVPRQNYPHLPHTDTKTTTPSSWVDEAFGGQTQLAVLENFPTSSEPDIERILSHLPGLVELTVSSSFPMSTRLLAALARSCPGLQVLRWEARQRFWRNYLEPPPSDLGALAPLSGVLRQLDLGDSAVSEESLTAFVGSLSAVTSLKLHSCPPAALEPIASHLTSLELRICHDLPGPWLCRLERLSLNLRESGPILAPLTLLLAANRATLRSLSLATDEPAESLIAPLRTLPCLTHLNLELLHGGCILSALPPVLVDRLESLTLRLDQFTETAPVRIASSHLQSFSLQVFFPTQGLILECPALVVLRSCAPLLSLCCPSLRTLITPLLEETAPIPRPDLEVAGPSPDRLWVDPVWLLTGSPRLREISGIHLTRPDLLARLCTCESLVRLMLRFDATRLPNPLVLRLPGQLEHLDLIIEMSARPAEGDPPLPPFDIQVEAPGLLYFNLAIDCIHRPTLRPDEKKPSVRVRLCHPSPSLDDLRLCSYHALLFVQNDEEEAGTPAMQPRDLFVTGNLDAASLVRLLSRHGARLSQIQVANSGSMASEDWAQLMAALSGLPRLIDLQLDPPRTVSKISLACPQLRSLCFTEPLLPEVELALDCPLLVDLFDHERIWP